MAVSEVAVETAKDVEEVIKNELEETLVSS